MPLMRTVTSLGLAAATAVLLSGCLGGAPTVTVLLTGSEENSLMDTAAFADAVTKQCADCDITFVEGNGEVADQERELVAALESADVVVVEPPVSGELTEESVAHEDALSSDEGAPVVALGTFVPGARAHIGFAPPVAETEFVDDLAAARAVVAGKVDSYQHVPRSDAAMLAAQAVLALEAGEAVPEQQERDGVPQWLLEAPLVSLENLTTVLVGSGQLSIEEICKPNAQRCSEFGLL